MAKRGLDSTDHGGHTKRKKKHPDAPKRCKSAFMFFTMDKRQDILADLDPGANKVTDVAKRASDMWKSMSSEERSKWENQAKEDRERYQAEKAKYTGPLQVSSKKKNNGNGDDEDSAPKRPMSAFLFFSQDMRPVLKQEKPDLKYTEMAKELGRMWREKTDEERKPYVDFEADRRREYKEAMTKWKAERTEREKEEKAQRQAEEKMRKQMEKAEQKAARNRRMHQPQGHPMDLPSELDDHQSDEYVGQNRADYLGSMPQDQDPFAYQEPANIQQLYHHQQQQQQHQLQQQQQHHHQQQQQQQQWDAAGLYGGFGGAPNMNQFMMSQAHSQFNQYMHGGLAGQGSNNHGGDYGSSVFGYNPSGAMGDQPPVNQQYGNQAAYY